MENEAKGKHREGKRDGRECLSQRVNDGEEQREIVVEAVKSEGELDEREGEEDRGREGK